MNYIFVIAMVVFITIGNVTMGEDYHHHYSDNYWPHAERKIVQLFRRQFDSDISNIAALVSKSFDIYWLQTPLPSPTT